MTIISRLLLILGIVSITYGLARAQIVPEVLSEQERAFEEFFAAHTDLSPNVNKDFNRLYKGVMLSGGMYPGWGQAIMPVALGLILVATGHYCGQPRKKVEKT